MSITAADTITVTRRPGKTRPPTPDPLPGGRRSPGGPARDSELLDAEPGFGVLDSFATAEAAFTFAERHRSTSRWSTTSSVAAPDCGEPQAQGLPGPAWRC